MVLSGKLGYRDDAVSGRDFVRDGCSCIIDAHASMALSDSFVKIVAWYHNDWPYAKRLVELMLHIQAVDHGVMMDAQNQ